MAPDQVISKRIAILEKLGFAFAAKRGPSNPGKLKQKAEASIDAFMRKVGYSNLAERIDEDGWRYFELGSAKGRAGVIENKDGILLCVEAPVCCLPSDNELIVALMREILEYNALVAGDAHVGLVDDQVVVRAVNIVEVMHEDDFGRSIHSVMSIADELDDHLIAQYGGTTKSRGKPDQRR